MVILRQLRQKGNVALYLISLSHVLCSSMLSCHSLFLLVSPSKCCAIKLHSGIFSPTFFSHILFFSYLCKTITNLRREFISLILRCYACNTLSWTGQNPPFFSLICDIWQQQANATLSPPAYWATRQDTLLIIVFYRKR